MAKTPILFAFGNHGFGKEPCNLKFFSDSISPILEDIEKSGTRGIIIHEGIAGPRLRLMDVPKFLRKDAEGRFKAIKRLDQRVAYEARRYMDDLRSTLDIGKLSRAQDEWGFEPALLSINTRTPRRIENVIEPQGTFILLTAMLMEYNGNWQNKNVRDIHDLKRLIRARLCSSSTLVFFRDLSLMRQIEKLAEEDPERTIIVPRGKAHFTMMNPFLHRHADRFDIGFKVEESDYPLMDACSMALTEALYQGRSDDGTSPKQLLEEMVGGSIVTMVEGMDKK